jgi:peptidase YpeB-like protein
VRARTMIIAGAAAVAAVAIAGGAVAAASGSDDDGPTPTGPQADRAIEAGLAATGGGHANSLERDSEDGATWEVEVTKPDGATVDVRLDANYKVVVIEGDGEDGGQ